MWKYKILDSSKAKKDKSWFKEATLEQIEEYPNDLGAQDWEIINLDFVMKHDRPNYFYGVAMRKQKQN